MPANNHIPNIQSVLLLGTNNILALPVIRSLGRFLPGVDIHTLSYRDEEQAISDLSRYVYQRHYLDTHYEDEELLHYLIQKARETGAEILLPIDEKDVRRVSAIKNHLRKYIHLPPLPNPELFDRLVHKNKLTKLLAEHDFPYATTYNLDEIKTNIIEDSFFPALLKPIRGSAGTGIKKISSRHQLELMLENQDSREFILQEIIPGQKIICNLIAEEGEIHAFNIQEDLESREYSFSTSIKFVKNESVARQVHKLIKDINYSGLANIDLMLDERDQQAKVVDFNARFWSSLSGSKAAGIDFTILACLAALGEPMNSSDRWTTHYGNVYHMGRSTIKYYRQRLGKPFSNSNGSTSTDFVERLTDPLPEILRLFQ